MDIELIWVAREPEYFLESNWTGQIRLRLFNNSPFCGVSPRGRKLTNL
jgi:hypothetical protein